MTRVNPSVPTAVKPALGGRRRTMGGFTLETAPSQKQGTVWIDPGAELISMSPSTYGWLRNDVQAIQFLVHEKAEAVRTMQVRMVDVSKYQPERVTPKRPAGPVPTGIKALCADLQALVGDMAGLDPTDEMELTSVVTRYGKMRDTMASLRAAFQEAEGSFELAQALLVAKMGDE